MSQSSPIKEELETIISNQVRSSAAERPITIAPKTEPQETETLEQVEMGPEQKAAVKKIEMAFMKKKMATEKEKVQAVETPGSAAPETVEEEAEKDDGEGVAPAAGPVPVPVPATRQSIRRAGPR